MQPICGQYPKKYSLIAFLPVTTQVRFGIEQTRLGLPTMWVCQFFFFFLGGGLLGETIIARGPLVPRVKARIVLVAL